MELLHGRKEINFSTTSDPKLPPPQLEKEHMFLKVVTPSDVGKLNRLVLPKQYAEKYFPLDSTANVKGLLLSFEDRHGKPWCFRYSYWNSSQSYVITKGWSRFVKDHRLRAGDTVYFSRGRGHRLFIDFKRRPLLPFPAPSVSNLRFPLLSFDRSTFFPRGGENLYSPSVAPASMPCVGVLDSVPVVIRQVAAKRVRLFGVNLECPESDGDGAPTRLERTDLPRLQLRVGGFSDDQQSKLDMDF